MAATIGIKIANGEFYSILNENSAVKKRLILTTVHDNQSSVQIDLYKSDTKTMADALYVGSLVVEKIKPRLKGIPSIELTISSGQNGNINADALDMDPANSSGHQYLNVSLQSLDDDSRDYDLPDFEMEDDVPPPTGLYEKAKTGKETKKKRSSLPVILCAALILIVAGLAVWYFLFNDTFPLNSLVQSFNREAPAAPAPVSSVAQTQPAQQPPASTPQQATAPEPVAPPPEPVIVEPVQPPPEPAPEPTPAPVVQAAPPPVIQAPAQAPAPATAASARNRPEPPVASYNVPATIPREGVPYRIRWGDTLWDIAAAFYRNPWLYPQIARFNNIRNPDRIISGTTIRIPPRN